MRVSEGALERVQNEARRAVVVEADEQFDHLASWKVGALRFEEQHVGLHER